MKYIIILLVGFIVYRVVFKKSIALPPIPTVRPSKNSAKVDAKNAVRGRG